MSELVIANQAESVDKALDFIKKELGGINISIKTRQDILELSKKMLTNIMKRCEKGDEMTVKVSNGLGEKTVKISGRCILPEDKESFLYQVDDTIVKRWGEKLSIKNKNNIGSLSVTVNTSAGMTFLKTVISVAVAIAIGMLFRTVFSADIISGISDYAIYPIENLFVNALTMIATPVTFFAIVATVSKYYFTFDENPAGKSLLWRYLLTAAVAIAVGGAIFLLMKRYITPAGGTQFLAPATESTSVIDMIANLIPSNLVKPFLESDGLQLLILAIITGVAVGSLSKKSKFTKDLFGSINELFIKILSMLFSLSPYALFFAVFGMTLSGGLESCITVIWIIVAIFIGLIILTLLHLIVAIPSGVNPIKFLKAYGDSFLTTLRIGSTIDCIPYNIENCNKKFGIDNKFLNYAVPFCAHNNMDGNCLFLSVTSLVFMRYCGVEMSAAMIIAAALMMIILSMGAPNQPGSGIICMAVILPAIGLKPDLMIPIIWSDLILEPFIAYFNNIGDMATTVAVAKALKEPVDI